MTTYIPKKYTCNACGHFFIRNQIASTNNFSRTDELKDKQALPTEEHCMSCKSNKFTVSVPSAEDYEEMEKLAYWLKEMGLKL